MADIAASVLAKLKIKRRMQGLVISSAYSFLCRKNFCENSRNQDTMIFLY